MSDIEYTIGDVNLQLVSEAYEHIYGSFRWGEGEDPMNWSYWSEVTRNLAEIYVDNGGDEWDLIRMHRVNLCSAADAATALYKAFRWGQTEEGHNYWLTVYSALLKIHRRQNP